MELHKLGDCLPTCILSTKFPFLSPQTVKLMSNLRQKRVIFQVTFSFLDCGLMKNIQRLHKYALNGAL